MIDDRRSDWQLIEDAFSDDPEPPDRRYRLAAVGCGILSALLVVGGVAVGVWLVWGWVR